MIRHQLLDVFSRGVKQSIESSTYSNDALLFNRKNGIYRDILKDDRYYKDMNKIDIQATTVQSRKGENGETDSRVMILYSYRITVCRVCSCCVLLSSLSEWCEE